MTASTSQAALAPGAPADGQSDGGPVGGALLMLCGIASFQMGASIAKDLFPLFGPLGMVGLRLWIAAIVLCALARPWRMVPDRATLWLIVQYGTVVCLMNMTFYLSLARLPLGIAVAIEFLGPLALALLGSRRPVDLLLVALAAAGLDLLLQPGAVLRGRGLDPLGVGFGLLAAASWAAYIVIGARVSRRIDATRATAIGLGVGALLLTPLAAATLPRIVSHPHAGLLAGLVAILSSAVPYTLEMLAMKRLHPRQYGILSSLDPAMAVVIGLVLLGEHPDPSQWTGILCIVLSSIIGIVIRQSGGQAAPPPAPDL
ncbi:EamA family transporter [Gluconacetobacter diazotrophicus]|uniref:EamA family transporter n=1 Tax=Gluconacetobacter diazotrophicus TaxID=33996 RepID=A0A7W4I6F4_GLUDI|nr:EamA family transporter [Gluconacetobacter diazotrophicus]MBB2157101.1 EamA family transporter [Gluconacetobacter diazotrophicus]